MNERERRYFAPLICLFALAVLLVGYLLTEGRGVHFATHGVPQTEENTFSTADFLVCLDAGHGGADPGAVEVAEDGVTVREKDITLLLAKKVGERLSEMGYRVCYTRKGDARMSQGNSREELHTRLAFCAENEVDLVLSLHLNAYRGEGRAYGARVFCNPDSRGGFLASSLFADSISQHTGAMIGRSARVEEDGSYAILSDESRTALLLELGFLTDPAELSLIRGEKWQNAMADALAEATDRYFREMNRAADACGSFSFAREAKNSPQKRNKNAR